jgi:hypothetical protein
MGDFFHFRRLPVSLMGCGSTAPVYPDFSWSLLRRVSYAMKEANWKFAVDEERSNILAVCACNSLVLTLRIDVLEDIQTIVCHISLERCCPSSARKALTKWCNLKNWDLQFGFFFCDQRDGEIGFRDSIDLRHIQVWPASINPLLQRSITTVDRNYAEISRLIYSAEEEE